MRPRLLAIALLTGLCTGLSAPVFAQMKSMVARTGHWEGSVGLYGTSSESASGTNGSGIDVDGGIGLSLGLGYHFSEHLAVRFDGSWARPDYSARFNTEEDGLVEIDQELSLFSGQVSGVYHLLPGAFTPYLQAGIGWTYVDSNVADGPPVTGCWWDPWWGYICSNFFSTYSETSFSWNLGAGLRYDLNRDMFVRGGYEMLSIDSGEGVKPAFDTFRLEIGWKF
jgi:opacity protein-like surface antigen